MSRLLSQRTINERDENIGENIPKGAPLTAGPVHNHETALNGRCLEPANGQIDDRPIRSRLPPPFVQHPAGAGNRQRLRFCLPRTCRCPCVAQDGPRGDRRRQRRAGAFATANFWALRTPRQRNRHRKQYDLNHPRGEKKLEKNKIRVRVFLRTCSAATARRLCPKDPGTSSFTLCEPKLKLGMRSPWVHSCF